MPYSASRMPSSCLPGWESAQNSRHSSKLSGCQVDIRTLLGKSPKHSCRGLCTLRNQRLRTAPLPRRLGKLRVEVETTVALSATRACTGATIIIVCCETALFSNFDISTFFRPCLVSHAQGAAGHLCSGTRLAVDRIVALLGQLLLHCLQAFPPHTHMK